MSCSLMSWQQMVGELFDKRVARIFPAPSRRSSFEHESTGCSREVKAAFSTDRSREVKVAFSTGCCCSSVRSRSIARMDERTKQFKQALADLRSFDKLDVRKASRSVSHMVSSSASSRVSSLRR
uniref:Uncharacterized protein n=1 Tax=Ditylenchus dipsaci TaxID=166011 RepID=A0A915DCV9_9BILA